LQAPIVPFAATKTERDPHLSIAERYTDQVAYAAPVKAAAAEMVAERLLLLQDADRAVELATQGKLSKLR
jgi:hypothetical protein